MSSEQSTQCHALWIIRPGALTLVMIAALTGVRIWVCGKPPPKPSAMPRKNDDPSE